MRTSFVFVSLVASLAWAQPRCDGANTKDLKCADVPEIMALETSECQPYHILISRGTDERPPGRMGNITKLVCDSVGGKDKCGWENVDYPAKNRFISETTWCDSADIGARNGQKQMADYVKKCPDTKLVLLGYSQGGSITQDFMGGGGGPIFKCKQVDNPPLDRKTSPGKNVAAAVTFGTVRRASSQSYSIESGKDFKSEGQRSEAQRKALLPYADAIQDYCHTGDPICATNSENLDLQNHLTYMELHQKDIVDFIVKKVTKPAGEDQMHHKPLLHKIPATVADHYWLTGALFFSLALSWLALFCYTSRRKTMRILEDF